MEMTRTFAKPRGIQGWQVYPGKQPPYGNAQTLKVAQDLDSKIEALLTSAATWAAAYGIWYFNQGTTQDSTWAAEPARQGTHRLGRLAWLDACYAPGQPAGRNLVRGETMPAKKATKKMKKPKKMLST